MSADGAAAKRAEDSASIAESVAHGARKEADSFERDIVSAKEKAANAELHLAGALTKAEKAERDLDAYKALRALTDEQAESLIKALKPFGPQTFEVTPYWQSKESMGIANELAAILVKGAGWKLDQPKSWTGLMGGVVGVEVFTHPDADGATKQAADTVVSELLKDGIEATRNF